MQVTLDPVDWSQLTAFADPADFVDWVIDLEDASEFRRLDCYANDWENDSAILYHEAGAVLEHLVTVCDPAEAEHLRAGFLQLIATDNLTDEFGLAAPSEGCFWISASPDSVRTIKTHIDGLNMVRCISSLAANPLPQVEITKDVSGAFLPILEQHARIVDLAVAHGYGLLGHCG